MAALHSCRAIAYDKEGNPSEGPDPTPRQFDDGARCPRCRVIVNGELKRVRRVRGENLDAS